MEKPPVLGIGFVCARICSHSLHISRRCGPSQGAAAVEHVCLVPSRGSPVASLPRDCKLVPGVGDNTGSFFFVRYCVDDDILVEVQWWPDGRRCLRAVQSLASDYFRLLGNRGASDPPLLSAGKITN